MKNDTVKNRFVRLLDNPKTMQNIYDIMMGDSLDTPAGQWLDENGNTVSISFGELNEKVRSMAGFLTERLGENQRGCFVGFAMENSHLWQTCFWALLMAGFKPVLIDVNQREEMVDYIIECAGLKSIVGKSGLALKNNVQQISLDELKSQKEKHEYSPKWADQLALCTSGTTATAKVLVFDGSAISSQLEGFYKVYLKDKRIASAPTPVKPLAFLPMHHVLGFITLCIAYPFLSKTIVYLKDRSPASIQAACQKIGVTHMVSVPLLINNLKNGVWRKVRQETPKKEKLLKMLLNISSSIQNVFPKNGDVFARRYITKSVIKKLFGDTFAWICVGGTHVPVESLKFMNGLGHCATIGYGMTECGIIAFEPGSVFKRRIDGSTGPLMYGFESKIIDADGREAGTGELLVKSPSMHIGKMKNGQMVSSDVDSEGWLHTGDIGRFEKGSLVIEGRLKEVILNEAGENIYPDELEDMFDNLPMVDRYCILGLNAGGSDDIGIVLEVQDTARSEQGFKDIIKSINDVNTQLPVMKKIRKVYVANEPMPLANGIKVRRQKLKELLENKTFSSSELNLNEYSGMAIIGAAKAAVMRKEPGIDDQFLKIREQVVQCFADVLHLDPAQIPVDKHFIYDLGGDSLDSLGLLAMAESKFGIMIDESEYYKCVTADDVSRLIYEKLNGTAFEKQIVTKKDDVKPITRFEDTPEYASLAARLESVDKTKNPYFISYDSVLRDVSTVDGKDVLNFASYNYLGLSGHSEVSAAAIDAINKLGTSASGSRLLAGEKTLHRQLEAELAEWKKTEAALVLVGGHSTNVTFVGNFCNEKDLILYDILSHNSVIQGLRLSKATSRAFPHNDFTTARAMLESMRNKFEKVLLIIEGAYSMDGDIAPVPEFVKLKKEFGLFLMVDEAHSSCVIGKNGGGVDEYFNLNPDDIDIKMGTLSKGLGTCGGYLAGKKSMIEYLKYTLPGFVFSVGLSPALAAATLAAIRIVRRDNSLVRRLHENIVCFTSEAKKRGFNLCLAGESAIVPILVGKESDAFDLSAALFEKGISVPPAVYPAVPANKARLRFCLTSCHKKEQITAALDILEDLAQKMNIVLPK
ncbi:MAG: aminotransferase class I/II-fold pyridoxal phosphate-dependent enzyme [Treponema sp.]|jgi:8-amino-7-oxononanoate synthase/acyl carrier protein|nr:aminotransferase class I/II-fold pyridoxal phosphate-dependent enzyme [Treponema sp.]